MKHQELFKTPKIMHFFNMNYRSFNNLINRFVNQSSNYIYLK